MRAIHISERYAYLFEESDAQATVELDGGYRFSVFESEVEGLGVLHRA